jgi:hypothetical protein
MTMTWREAAIAALEGAGPMSPEQVSERIGQLGLRDLTGDAPERVVEEHLNQAVCDGDPRVRQPAAGLFEHASVADAPHTAESLGRIETLDVRRIWADEARDFTPWLFDNPDVLSEALGIELDFEGREHGVGAFSVDIFGRDLTHECPLIVENQLEDTDHRHLGQLLTYAAGTDANTVVWVAPRFRDEHRQALEYLNNMAGDSARFFGVELRLAVIGDSIPAPMLTLAAKPSDWRARLQAQKVSSGLTDTQLTNVEFWTHYLDYVHEKYPRLTNVKSPQKTSWMNLNFMGRGLTIGGAFIRGGELSCELYIDLGDAAQNEAVLDTLMADREAIEASIGAPLLWQRLEGKRACRVRLTRMGEIGRTDQRKDLIQWLAEHQAKFKATFKPRLENLDSANGEPEFE